VAVQVPPQLDQVLLVLLDHAVELAEGGVGSVGWSGSAGLGHPYERS
jgi:hypothetical protein